MAKNLKARALSGVGALAFAVGLSGLAATAANAAIEYPHMEIDVVCTEGGKTATITATTTGMGSFGDWYPSDGPAEIRNVSQVVTLDGVVVRETEHTYYGHTETFTVDLPEGYFIIDGHFLEYWWEKGDDRVVNDPPRMMYYDHDPVNVDMNCGWITDTNAPVDPEPEDPETPPEVEEPVEEDGELDLPVTGGDPEPEKTETEALPESSTEATETPAAGAAEDELPPTGSSPVLSALAAGLMALGGAALLISWKVRYQA